MKLSIIIPVFKGEFTLIPLFNTLIETFNTSTDFEVIFIDDNSTDNSWKRISDLYKQYPAYIKGFRLKQNYGQHKATLFGLGKATGEFAVTMDEDMQHDPQFIPAMLSYLCECKSDVVYGKFIKYNRNSLRMFGSKVSRGIARLLIPELSKSYSPFRIIRSDIIKLLVNNRRRNVVFIDGLIGKATKNTGEYPIEHFEDKRPSSYSVIKLVRLAISVTMNYSPVLRNLLVLVILILVYFSLAAVINLPGSLFFLAGLPAVILFIIIAGMVLYSWIHSNIYGDIRISETTGNN